MITRILADNPNPAPRQSIQVIARAARILRALEGEHDGLSLGQIARRVGLARSTVQRIVDALGIEHFVMAASPSGGVRLGPALIRLAASASVEIGKITRPLLIELAQKVGETVDLSALKGNGAVFIDQVQGLHRLRAVSAIGETFPLYCTANGKALLSLQSAEKLRHLTGLPMLKLTRKTNIEPAGLLSEVKKCRRTLVAYDIEEHTDGICAVGSAFLDPMGRAMALSIPVPTARFNLAKPELVTELLIARQRIVNAIGGPAAA